MNSINLKTILLNAQPSDARAENSAKLMQVLCDRCTSSVERLSTSCRGIILEVVILIHNTF